MIRFNLDIHYSNDRSILNYEDLLHWYRAERVYDGRTPIYVLFETDTEHKHGDFSDVTLSDCHYLCYGYSQGDLAGFLFVGSKEFKQQMSTPEMQDYLQKVLYASPIYAQVEIDEVSGEFEHTAKCTLIDEFYIDEYLNDAYHYDKEEIIDIIKQHYNGAYKAELLDYVVANLPDYLDYV